jgi:hypothetical protein
MPGAEVLERERFAGQPVRDRDEGRPVVGHHARDGDAVGALERQRSRQEGDRGPGFLVGDHLDVGQAGRIKNPPKIGRAALPGSSSRASLRPKSWSRTGGSATTSTGRTRRWACSRRPGSPTSWRRTGNINGTLTADGPMNGSGHVGDGRRLREKGTDDSRLIRIDETYCLETMAFDLALR